MNSGSPLFSTHSEYLQSAQIECTYVALSATALGIELATFRSIENHMLNSDATAFARDLIASLRNGGVSYALARIREDPNGHHKALAQSHLNHEQNKVRMKGLIDSTKQLLPAELQKRMRSARLPDDERIQLIYDLAISLLPQILCEQGFSSEKSRAFMKQKPIVLRYFFVKIWHCVAWIERGGFECFRANGVTNDALDQQYVLGATFFHDILTLDTKIKNCYNDLLLILQKKI